MAAILTDEAEACLVPCTWAEYRSTYEAAGGSFAEPTSGRLGVGATASFSDLWYTEWWDGDLPYCASLRRGPREGGTWEYWRQDAEKVKAWMERPRND